MIKQQYLLFTGKSTGRQANTLKHVGIPTDAKHEMRIQSSVTGRMHDILKN